MRDRLITDIEGESDYLLGKPVAVSGVAVALGCKGPQRTHQCGAETIQRSGISVEL